LGKTTFRSTGLREDLEYNITLCRNLISKPGHSDDDLSARGGFRRGRRKYLSR